MRFFNTLQTSPSYSLTSAIVAFVAGVSNLCSELQIVPSFIIRRPISPQGKHAPSKASQVTHLTLQVAIFPLPDESKTAVGLTDEVALDSLQKERERENEQRTHTTQEHKLSWQPAALTSMASS